MSYNTRVSWMDLRNVSIVVLWGENHYTRKTFFFSFKLQYFFKLKKKIVGKEHNKCNDMFLYIAFYPHKSGEVTVTKCNRETKYVFDFYSLCVKNVFILFLLLVGGRHPSHSCLGYAWLQRWYDVVWRGMTWYDVVLVECARKSALGFWDEIHVYIFISAFKSAERRLPPLPSALGFNMKKNIIPNCIFKKQIHWNKE